MARKAKVVLANANTINNYHRMDYPSKARQFGGLENEAINDDGEIILPTEGCKNFDIFVCKDTMKVLMYYEKDGWTEMK